MVTGTASGKSLAFNLPVLQALAGDPKARAIYLYPTKALAQDQARSLRAARARPGARPGDLRRRHRAADRRAARAHANLILTNPDMLHAGILPGHSAWARRARTTSSTWWSTRPTPTAACSARTWPTCMARLRRMCRPYGADAAVCITSATIANPGEAAERLAGGPVTVIDHDGSPAAEREIAIWNPPLLDELLGVRASTLGEAATLLAGLVARGVRTIVFAKSRAGCELVYRYAREGLERHDPAKARRLARLPGRATPPSIAAGSSGRWPTGELLGVVATNALELGIDIGLLDCAISVGFPGSTASLRQQWGRAGRRARRARDLRGRRGRARPVPRPPPRRAAGPAGRGGRSATRKTPACWPVHLRCAAAERPLIDERRRALRRRRRWRWRPSLPELVRTREGLAYRGSDHPSANVSLRSTGSAVAMVERQIGRAARADGREPGARLGAPRAPSTCTWASSTWSPTSTSTAAWPWCGRSTATTTPRPSGCLEHRRSSPSEPSRRGMGMRVVHGDIEMREQVVGYQRKRLSDHTAIDLIELELPQQQLHAPRRSGSCRTVDPADDLLGSLHAAEHALIALLPLLAMCDRGDIGGLSTDLHFQTGVPTVFVYDGHPGGVGHRRARLRAVRDVGAAHRDPAVRVPVRRRLPLVRAVAEVRQPERAAVQSRRAAAARAARRNAV